MKKIKQITEISFLVKLLFFIKYYLKNFDKFSIIPSPFYRIFRLNYWRTLIYYTHLRSHLFKIKYSDKKFHKLKIDKTFNYNDWKYNSFSKRPYLDLRLLVDEIYSIKTKNIKILDVGCGPGEIAANLISMIKNKQIDYTGVDFSPSAISKGKKAFKVFSKKKNFTYKFYQNNFTKFNLTKKKNFDYSFSVSVMEMIEKKDIRKFIENMCNQTKTGIFLNENNENFPGSKLRNHKFYEKLFYKYGFKLDRYKYQYEKVPRGKGSFEFYRLIAFFKRFN